jgi:CMP-N-acetylneuraminic acid synthetase
MIEGKKVLCIIPLRAGSQRLPGKNLLDLCGRPLYRWVMGEAERCKGIDKIVVTTDIKKNALHPGNYDYYSRPPELATESATTEAVITDVITKEAYEGYDIIVLLQATSPLTCLEDIENALEFFTKYELVSLVSVNENYYPNGAIYIKSMAGFLQVPSFWVDGMGVLKMCNERSVDIDGIWDFRVAEAMLKGLVFPDKEPHPRRKEVTDTQ